MSNMSSPLSEIDRELIGEVPFNNTAKATMAKANDEPGLEAHDDHHVTGFTPLNATAGTLVKVSRNGDEVKTSKVDKGTEMDTTEPAPKTPKKRGATASANDESAQPTKKRSPTKKATAATNIESNTNGDATEPITPSPKKRASPKKKTVASANANAETGDDSKNGETEGLEPVTPKKAKRAPAKGKGTKASDESAETTDKSISPTKGNGEIEGTTVHNTPRKRQAPKKELAAPRGIPSSWDNADHADRMMVVMKEKGEGWTEIRAAWKEVTGQETASSTLPNRYNRIKVNMMRMKDGDTQHLLASKKEIEDTYASTFWANVASAMERRGADKYPTAFLQKTFKELESKGTTVIDSAGAGTGTGTAEGEGEGEGEGVKEEEGEGEGGA